MKRPSIIRSASVIGGFTMISRILGLVRDVLMAGLFGTSFSMSAFVIAFTVPNLFRRLFGEGALSAAFVPVFIETRHEQGDAAAWILARRIITLLALTLLGMILLGEAAISCLPRLVSISDNGLHILSLVQIMLPYMLFICLAALSMAILNAYGHFAVPAATPCLLNISWILSLIVVCPLINVTPEQRIYVVASAVLLAGILQLGFQIPVLMKYGYHPGISLRFDDKRVTRILTLMGPAAAGLALTQINVLVDRLLAYFVGSWAAAALFFSERIIYLPLGIFATAMSTVLLPTFSHQAAGKNYETICKTITYSLRNLLFIMVPAATGLFVLAHPIIRMIFQWGVFDGQSTWYAATALQCYAPGLIIFSLAKVLVPAFYSIQDTKTPLKIGALTVLMNIVINISFILILPLKYKHAGIAAATVIAETFYAITLAILLARRIGSLDWKSISNSLFRTFFAAAVMGFTAWVLSHQLTQLLLTTSLPFKVQQITTVSFAIIGSLIVFLLAALCMRCSEIKDILASLRRRSSKKNAP